ncbi:MAG: LysR family transcriptional regulator [Chloroflexi bacterium]|nr:LysR family transcriptional regulator [Chloroflexota bacterium]
MTSAEGSRPPPVLYYLHTFHMVALEQSFTRAARRLDLSQPAVSAHIRALEHYYGVPLFEVRQRRTHLTASGEALFAYINRVFHLLDEANQVLEATRFGQHGLVCFGASTTLGNYLLPTVLGAFGRAHPGVKFEAAVGTSADVLAWLKADRVQFGFVEAPLHDADVQVEPLGQDELVLSVAARHPLARRQRMSTADLVSHPILRREATSGTQQLVDTELARAGAMSPTQLVLGSTEALKQAVLQGVGLAWLPRLAIRHELGRGELTSITVDGLQICRTLSLIRMRGARLSAAADALVREVGDALAHEPISTADG